MPNYSWVIEGAKSSAIKIQQEGSGAMRFLKYIGYAVVGVAALAVVVVGGLVNAAFAAMSYAAATVACAGCACFARCWF